MTPEEKPSFYLYSIGYSPKVLTLGTLVYDNYGMPENKRVTFPMSQKEFEQLKEQNEIISTEVSGCFTFNKESKYGLGLGFAELANLDFEYAKKCQKVVQAKVGKRVTLNHPDEFFVKILQRPETLDKLTTWLTAAKSAWIFYQAAFQKPRVYCCTGFYELSQTTARITNGGKFSAELSVSPEVIAVASGGFPVGGTIGPFANGKSLETNFSAPEAGIWAARYHQLKVEYLQIAAQGTTRPPRSIILKPDCTHPRGGLMGDDRVVEETTVVKNPDEIRYAQGAVATLEDAKEIEDQSPDDRYWEAFREAEERLEINYDSELDD
ncbi:hypothetical protein BKA66DRAFT_470048 [Pyrenochaeta sp. MPI-SDFR-AT-0127]|nr:hypothetical protein BKA66DRAFT_470048 [Pyrenochaeta sp. MPI-SDFR-AT-0127]